MTTGAVGFIGLGVMGEPMCRNLAEKCGRAVVAHDRRPEPLARLAAAGVAALPDVAGVARAAETIFLSLPDGAAVDLVCRGADGLLAHARAGQTIVDTSTAPVALARDLAGAFAGRGVVFLDAPVARTRAAAEAGTLSIMVGGAAGDLERIRPLLACMASEITHCGPVGAGQVVKILNNMVLFQTVVALAEAMAAAEGAGVDPAVLLDGLSKGSGDSFALRNHAMKAMLPGVFPERAFSTDYARKDLGYALELMAAAGIEAGGAANAAAVLEGSAKAGNAHLYFPALARLFAPRAG